uniref:endoribonuclease YicC domain-containing protein n=1 Tax=Megasphaera sp. TaxID=2023260 RepID=UPI0040270CDD
LQGAVDSLVALLEREGSNISRYLLRSADKIAALVESIASRKEIIVQAYEERLEKKILALMDKVQAAVPDEDRLLQEVAIYSDKVDFTEEVVRFRSHLNQLHAMLQSPGEVGRKLDFLIQEMNRETNTIGSKAGDLAVTEAVLQLKNEIEKIREQVQNIE